MTPGASLTRAPLKPLPEATSTVIQDGRLVAVGSDVTSRSIAPIVRFVINANRRRVIPGLNDSYIHVIRGGLHYHLELR